MTSMEVVNNMGDESENERPSETHQLLSPLGHHSARSVSTPASLDDGQPRNNVRDSVLKSLGWLTPMLDRYVWVKGNTMTKADGVLGPTALRRPRVQTCQTLPKG